MLGSGRGRLILGAFQHRTATCFDLGVLAEARGAARGRCGRERKGRGDMLPPRASLLQPQNCPLANSSVARCSTRWRQKLDRSVTDDHVKGTPQGWPRICSAELISSSRLPLRAAEQTVASDALDSPLSQVLSPHRSVRDGACWARK